MTNLEFKRDIIPTIIAALVLTAIYINLEIMMEQSFYHIFEGSIDLFPNNFIVFMIIFVMLIGIQYLIRQERPIKDVLTDM